MTTNGEYKPREQLRLAQDPDSIAEECLHHESDRGAKHWSIKERDVNVGEMSEVAKSGAEPVECISALHSRL